MAKLKFDHVSPDSGTTYHLTHDSVTGKMTCSCKGWIFHQHKDCKHIQAMRNKMTVAKVEAAPVPGLRTVKKKIAWEVADRLVRSALLQLLMVSYALRFEICGSYRRKKRVVGDLDIIVNVPSGKAWSSLLEAFREIGSEIESGEVKARFQVKGIQIDLNRVKQEAWGCALCHFTGSVEENIRLRKLALQKGYSLSQYGMKKSDGDVIPFESEEGVYRFLGTPYVKPEDRS